MKIFIHVIVPLLIGLAIYILFRGNTWFHQHFLPDGFTGCSLPQNWLSHILIFNIPDFCWNYSLASALFILKNNNYPVKVTALSVLLILLAAEFIQYLFPRQFTFDWLDVIAALLAFALSYSANRQNEKT